MKDDVISFANDLNPFLAYLTASGGGVQHWIGLNDLDSKGSYVWSDHTPVTFVNWADGGNYGWSFHFLCYN